MGDDWWADTTLQLWRARQRLQHSRLRAEQRATNRYANGMYAMCSYDNTIVRSSV